MQTPFRPKHYTPATVWLSTERLAQLATGPRWPGLTWRLWALLLAWADYGGWVWGSQRQLAQALAADPGNVNRSLAQLTSAGIVTVHVPTRRTPRLRLHPDVAWRGRWGREQAYRDQRGPLGG